MRSSIERTSHHEMMRCTEDRHTLSETSPFDADFFLSLSSKSLKTAGFYTASAQAHIFLTVVKEQ